MLRQVRLNESPLRVEQPRGGDACEALQHLIAPRVAMRVVDALEVVEVAKRDAEGRAVPGAALDLRFEQGRHVAPVHEAGEFIPDRDRFDAFESGLQIAALRPQPRSCRCELAEQQPDARQADRHDQEMMGFDARREALWCQQHLASIIGVKTASANAPSAAIWRWFSAVAPNIGINASASSPAE